MARVGDFDRKNTHMKIKMIGALGACCIGASQAAITVTIAEVGGNVVMSHSAGTLDTSGLSIDVNSGSPYAFYTGALDVVGGGADPSGNLIGYAVAAPTVSAGWTNSGSFTPWSSTTGTGGLLGGANYAALGPHIFIMDDSVGEAIVGLNDIEAFSGTVNGATFASLGLTANESMVFDLGNGDTLTFTTVPVPVPEPSSALLGLIGLVALVRRRR